MNPETPPKQQLSPRRKPGPMGLTSPTIVIPAQAGVFFLCVSAPLRANSFSHAEPQRSQSVEALRKPHPPVSSRGLSPGPIRLSFCRGVDWTPATSAGVTVVLLVAS